MDALECIMTRRSNRKYLAQSVEEKSLEVIVEAG